MAILWPLQQYQLSLQIRIRIRRFNVLLEFFLFSRLVRHSDQYGPFRKRDYHKTLALRDLALFTQGLKQKLLFFWVNICDWTSGLSVSHEYESCDQSWFVQFSHSNLQYNCSDVSENQGTLITRLSNQQESTTAPISRWHQNKWPVFTVHFVPKENVFNCATNLASSNFASQLMTQSCDPSMELSCAPSISSSYIVVHFDEQVTCVLTKTRSWNIAITVIIKQLLNFEPVDNSRGYFQPLNYSANRKETHWTYDWCSLASFIFIWDRMHKMLSWQSLNIV